MGGHTETRTLPLCPKSRFGSGWMFGSVRSVYRNWRVAMVRTDHLTKTRAGKGSLATMLLSGLLLIGLILRLVITFRFPSINHPDEIYQTLEQARRLTTGEGFVPWEVLTGIRSWALPGLFAGLMEIAGLAGSTPENY